MNHSSRLITCLSKPVKQGNDFYICLFSVGNIPAGAELSYDYGVSGLDWQKVNLVIITLI